MKAELQIAGQVLQNFHLLCKIIGVLSLQGVLW